MMRVFFCAVPAILVFVLGGIICGALFDGIAREVVAITGCCALAMFGLGWQVTDPKREAERERAAQAGKGVQ